MSSKTNRILLILSIFFNFYLIALFNFSRMKHAFSNIKKKVSLPLSFLHSNQHSELAQLASKKHLSLPADSHVGIVLMQTSHDKQFYSYPFRKADEYASEHNYTLLSSFYAPSLNRPAIWSRIPLLYSIISETLNTKVIDHPKYGRWLWSMDYDAAIMNKNLNLENHIFKRVEEERRAQNKVFTSTSPLALTAFDTESVNIIMAKDCNGINAGSFFIRADSEWSLKFLEAVWINNDASVPNIDIWQEQASMAELLRISEAKRTDAGIHSWNEKIDRMIVELNIAESFYIVPQQWLNSYGFDGCGHKYQEGDLYMHFPGFHGLFDEYMEKHGTE